MNKPSQLNRRDFIRGMGVTAIAGTSVVRSLSAFAAEPSTTFTHGVASGDPLSDRVIIWTRVSPSLGASVPVLWDVALDANFTLFVRRGRAIASSANDNTVKVDVLGLPANTHLYYRFKVGTEFSATGRTRTLPTGNVQQVKMAVFSCSNYPAGYFHVYAEVAMLNDVDVAMHIGDYIYEYPADGYASGDAASLGRTSTPTTELYSLADYRQRYAQYRSDPNLQAAHAALPWVCVWDDHEVANDTWKAGAENHDPATEGDFFVRRAAAMKAYHEWLPIRAPNPSRLELIYRSFKFGDLLDLHMLDTRHIGRDKQLSYNDYFGASGFDVAAFTTAMSNPSRQMMGTEQMQWLTAQMAGSASTWTVLGQQVLMARMNIPAPLVLNQISFSKYTALVYKAQTAPATLTSQEQDILAQPAIPYNLDAWDGYTVAREQLLGTARALNKNLVVLAGDTHNAWASDLLDLNGNQVGVEFGTTSVSSPGFEEYFPNENPLVVAGGLEQIIGPLVYAETGHRGFMVVTATPQECRCEWRYVSTVKSMSYSAYSGKTLRTLPGVGNRKLIAA